MRFEISCDLYKTITEAYPEKSLFICPCDIEDDDVIDYRLHPDYPHAETVFEIIAVYRDGKLVWQKEKCCIALTNDS